MYAIRARAKAGVAQRELAKMFSIPQSLCSEIVTGRIWDPDAKLTTGDEMRDRLIGALDTGCRRGEMLKIQNKHVEWQHRWIRILKENSKTEVARVIPFERGSRLEEVLRRRAFLGPEAYVFGDARTGEYVRSFRSAWETLLLVSHAASWLLGRDITDDPSVAPFGASTCAGTTCGTRRSLVSQTKPYPSTSCSSWPVTPTSRRRSAT